MEVFKAITNRRSIRKYKNSDIEDEKVAKILEAARLAPSATNRQEWKFIVVKNGETRENLVDAAKGQKFIAEAPVIIVACSTESDNIMPCGQYAYTVDLSIAMSFIILEATELGLGTCWLGAFNEVEVRNILDIPKEVRVVGMTTLGYPGEEPASRSRKNSEEIICYEKYCK